MTVQIATAKRERIDSYLPTAPEHMRAILFAVRDYGIGWATIPQRIGRFELPTDKPTLAVIGDDLHVSLGPAGFHRKSIRRVLAKCRIVSVISCEPLPFLYAAPACSSAGFGVNSAIIETRPEHEMQWVALVKDAAPDAQLLIGSVQERGD